jgi:hypothetical protein
MQPAGVPEDARGSQWHMETSLSRACLRHLTSPAFVAGNGPYIGLKLFTLQFMGIDWSKQCYAARAQEPARRLSAVNSSFYTLVAAFAVVALASAFKLLRHVRAPTDLWKQYVWFVGLTCVGNLLGDMLRAASVYKTPA